MPNQTNLANVSQINIDNNDLSAERRFKHRVRVVHRRRTAILIVFLVIFSIILGWHIYQANHSKALAQEAMTSQERKLAKAKDKRADLKTEVKQLHDPEYLDNLIRYRFNYSKDGEIIYNIPNEANKNLNF
ncbi:septum formation initiator family protein [Bombilactobacillus folatiphilus]|uniref:Septum formation initiator family protein n=1 Tax=Bombilactobacillus folatiphilus TaxID=2923362 RepID=A0ABY4P9P1_9LACO|nr:septum formation initiator family protein [Bombilactobacillus folatiphilus]UQS82335.1 septum formation initiator family protein [Bombilactobacillus folatiphilus]